MSREESKSSCARIFYLMYFSGFAVSFVKTSLINKEKQNHRPQFMLKLIMNILTERVFNDGAKVSMYYLLLAVNIFEIIVFATN